jgi:hypothetical protein
MSERTDWTNTGSPICPRCGYPDPEMKWPQPRVPHPHHNSGGQIAYDKGWNDCLEACKAAMRKPA